MIGSQQDPAWVTQQLSVLAMRLQNLLAAEIRRTSKKVTFREEYAKAIRVSAPRFDVTGQATEFAVYIDQAAGGGGVNKAMIAEYGFGGNGPSDSSPRLGRDGPYRMNELLLKNHPGGVNVKFEMNSEKLSKRLIELSNVGRLRGMPHDPAVRQQRVDELRRQIFGGVAKADPYAYKTGRGFLQPTNTQQTVNLLGSNVFRMRHGGIAPVVPTLAGPHRAPHKANKIEGLMRVDVLKVRPGKRAKIESIAYVAFRRLTENSGPWIHPGIKGLHLLSWWRMLPGAEQIRRQAVDVLLQYKGRGWR